MTLHGTAKVQLGRARFLLAEPVLGGPRRELSRSPISTP